ncbi:protein FAM83D [Anguilla rostrata]|uniref:protein FAM83D n=1 Tax=Anguilla rostrata TaxID=7938 RepID=UPI0030D3E36A
MALSQCLDDSPGLRAFMRGDINIQELYNERHRLALEELVAGGVNAYLDFLKKERIPNFLSDEEIQRISIAAVVPRCVSLLGEDTGLEQSMTSSMDCSSVTYFPEVSDVEPPLLEIGWPAFTAGSYRGVTRVVAHFQPSYGECIYSCKEAARRMIKSAKEVIAVVTDSLTDLDIFRDLREACTQRRVPVYILLDQSCVPSFLQMCQNLNLHLDEMRQMRVRTITGATYFLRSGARITGKVHERFMLIDGNRVATGSYRFNWTDGKLNSSNLIELSGQVTEHFDEEFRILYAQSLPISARASHGSARNSGIYEHLLLKPPAAAPPPIPLELQPELSRLTSTPNRVQVHSSGTEGRSRKSSALSDSSTLGEDWMEQEHMREVLVDGIPAAMPMDTLMEGEEPPVLDVPAPPSCHTSTQTCTHTADHCMQTDPEAPPKRPRLPFPSPGAVARSDAGCAPNTQPRLPVRQPPPPDGNLRDCFHKLTKERQFHYTTIRTKLDHMVALLSHRRELVDLTNLALSPRLHRARKGQPPDHSANLPMGIDGTLMNPWRRQRCLQ